MKEKYFLNTENGEIRIVVNPDEYPSPFNFPDVGANGWCEVSHSLYVVLQKVGSYAVTDYIILGERD